MKLKITALLLLFLAVGLWAVFRPKPLGDEWRKKAEAGDAVAQSKLGNRYENGDGVQKDSAEAAKWYRKSAEQGNAGAQFQLGYMYAKGNGVLKNSTEAAKWYRKSAEQGDAGAQVFLSGCYYVGEGVPKDIVSAHAWANNASANGDERGKIIIGMMESMLTPEQIAEATKLAREIFERIEAKKK